ncbi:Nse1 non-SMC component of SMC5-6 complex-domain-containing protein [Amylostereum chailletii]|nr:Nse1 non-SMC component of SMC5-6 complex-domain-containing protein [Amylostereum chailletii]
MVSSNDVQKLFLQAIISRRYLSTGLAKVLWQKSVETVKAVDPTINVTHGDDTDFENFVNSLNDSINGLDLEFVRLHDEETGKEMRALVNRKDDEIAQIATDFTPVEIAYFKALVEDIMLAPNDSYSLSSLAALRDNPKPSTMSKSQAETVLASFVARGWLLKSK